MTCEFLYTQIFVTDSNFNKNSVYIQFDFIVRKLLNSPALCAVTDWPVCLLALAAAHGMKHN